MKKNVARGAVKVLHLVRIVIVAVVCLLIGFSARQLLDAYGPKMVPFLEKELLDRQVHVQVHEGAPPQQDLSVSLEPVEPRWN